MPKVEIFELGDYATQRGTVLPNAKLAYATIGELNAKKNNVVICPTWFTGYINDVVPIFTGKGRAIDPAKHFVIFPALFGMGESSSPSNTPAPYEFARFPHVTYYDNVSAQHRLVTEKFGIEEIALVSSWSMGGTQSFQWGAQYPDMVKAIAPVACSARTSVYNQLFLKSNIKAIRGDPALKGGHYGNVPPLDGLRMMAHVYAGWGMTEEFYRLEVFKLFGHPTLDDFLTDFWEAYFTARDANNLLAQMWTWMNGDIGNQPAYGGDFEKALGSIKAKAVVMPAASDQYFTPIDSEAEVAKMPNATLKPLHSAMGHFAPYSSETQSDIDAGIREAMSKA